MTDLSQLAKALTPAQRTLLRIAATNEFAITYDSRELYTGALIKCLAPFIPVEEAQRRSKTAVVETFTKDKNGRPNN